MSELVSPKLFDAPIIALSLIKLSDANRLLTEWGHRLGEVHRPCYMQAFALELDGSPIVVAISANVASATVGGYQKTEVVELARQAAHPGYPWANRVMLRLWRETCATRWPTKPVKAVVSYSHNSMHPGDLYRFDGWKKIRDDCGSSGGGTWSTKRTKADAVSGKKTLWLYRYASEVAA